jgi:hypothetical protein
MKKNAKKLTLHRDTLKKLEKLPAQEVAAGAISQGSCPACVYPTGNISPCKTCYL